MKIIVFANHKGGVGKTTSTLSVAQTLARDGHRVLLIDCDAQRNLSLSFRLPAGYPDLGLVLERKARLADILLPVEENLHLVAATPDLDYLEKMVGQQLGYEAILRKGLQPLQDQYDYCLVDTPPSLSALTYMALVDGRHGAPAGHLRRPALSVLGLRPLAGCHQRPIQPYLYGSVCCPT